MNDTLVLLARNSIKNGLLRLSDNQHKLFKQMYSHDNLDMNIDDVVDSIPADNLDWAMQQVQRAVDFKEN